MRDLKHVRKLGTYQLLLTQRRIVEVIPATTEQITCCRTRGT